MNKIKIIQGRNANANMSKLVTSAPPSKLAHLVFIFCIYFLLKMPIFPLHLKLITTGCISMLQTHSYLPLCMMQSVPNTCINELCVTVFWICLLMHCYLQLCVTIFWKRLLMHCMSESSWPNITCDISQTNRSLSPVQNIIIPSQISFRGRRRKIFVVLALMGIAWRSGD